LLSAPVLYFVSIIWMVNNLRIYTTMTADMMIEITYLLFCSVSFIIFYFVLIDCIPNMSIIVTSELSRIFVSIIQKCAKENASSKNNVVWWMMTMRTTYFTKALTPKVWKDGVGLFPSSILVNNFIIPSRKKATNTVAKACIPGVFEKISIVRPKIKASISKNQRGI